MGIEIKRKFLVKMKKGPMISNRKYEITQGYILNLPEKVIRIRIFDNSTAYITIKGKNENMTRPEYEYNIPCAEGAELIKVMCTDIITKTRYICNVKNSKWEVDFFHGDNEGLIVAEIELKDEDDPIDYPEWIGKEVTGKKKYYNNNLIKNPYKDWSK